VDTATAPAREVIIYDTLDASVFDISTLRFTSFAFGDSSYTIDIQDNLFATEIDLRPAKNVILRVMGNLDTLTNVVTWKFQTFDTSNYELTLNVDDGFLPPNITRPEGEGYVTYSIKPVTGLPHLKQLKNSAFIIFDANEPIGTGTFLNTIDTISPSSQVNINPVFINDTTFILSWSGTDKHAGVSGYDIYVSINDGAFALLTRGTSKTSATLYGVPGDKYEFYSMATDLADNKELPPVDPDVSPDATVILGINEVHAENFFIVYPNPVRDELFISSSKMIDEIKVYDMYGKEIYKTHLPSHLRDFRLQISAYPAGVYFILVVSEDRTGKARFIKMK